MMDENVKANTYTVGVVVDRTGVMTSKAGKKFVSVKFSDLQKYDRTLVRNQYSKVSSETAKI
jgi:hypothetical protein